MVLARIRTRIIPDLPGQRQKEILSQANAKEKNIEKKIEFFFIFFHLRIVSRLIRANGRLVQRKEIPR